MQRIRAYGQWTLKIFVLRYYWRLDFDDLGLPMYEIHDYHFNPEKFDEYKTWVIEEVVPYLRANMDLVSFWVGDVAPPAVGGTSPMEMELGTPNATWIARWDSMEDCLKSRETVLATDEWKSIWANHPDADGYIQYQTRYMEGY